MINQTNSAFLIATLLVSGSVTTEANSVINTKNKIEILIPQLDSCQDCYKKNLIELKTYNDLHDDWDGYGAKKPLLENIETAYRFLEKLKEKGIQPPSIMPSTQENVTLFWRSKNNYLSLSFDSINHFSFFSKFDKKVYGRDDIEFSNDIPLAIIEHINKMFGNTNNSFIVKDDTALTTDIRLLIS